MSTATETETIEHLDFNEARTCEHVFHAHPTIMPHADGGELFVRTTCPDCDDSEVTVRCSAFLRAIAAGWTVYCPCGRPGGMEFYTILGPANP